MMEYMTVLGMNMVLLFLDSRYSRRRTVLAVYSTMFAAMIAVAVVYRTAGLKATLWLYPLLAHVPSLLLILVLSRFRGWRLIFQLLSAILFCTVILHGSALAFYFSGRNLLVLILSCAVLTIGVLLLLIRVESPLMRVVVRIVLLPVIAGVSYEVLKLAGNSDNPVVNLLSKPGMAIQKMTTSEPDDGMIEVAIQAVEAVFDWRAYERDNFHTS